MSAHIYKLVGLLVLVSAIAANSEELGASKSPPITGANTSELAAGISVLADNGLAVATAEEDNVEPVSSVAGSGTWALVVLGLCGLLVARRASAGK